VFPVIDYVVSLQLILHTQCIDINHTTVLFIYSYPPAIRCFLYCSVYLAKSVTVLTSTRISQRDGTLHSRLSGRRYATSRLSTRRLAAFPSLSETAARCLPVSQRDGGTLPSRLSARRRHAAFPSLNETAARCLPVSQRDGTLPSRLSARRHAAFPSLS